MAQHDLGTIPGYYREASVDAERRETIADKPVVGRLHVINMQFDRQNFIVSAIIHPLL